MCHTFKDEAEKLNQNNYSFTNETLYRMCQENPDILNAAPTVLAGKIEMIGRVYAASPERRSYKRIKFKGKTILEGKTINYEINSSNYSILKTSENSATFPSWVVKTLGDGQGSFFMQLVKELSASKDFEQSYQDCNKSKFEFDFSDNDITLLKNVIKMVLSFNEMVKEATMKIDEAPKKIQLEDVNGTTIKFDVSVRNQISFCSKFLHFHLPHHIFIIDSYSNQGGSLLFPNKSQPSKNQHDKKQKKTYFNGKEIDGWNILACLLSPQKEFPNSKLCKRIIKNVDNNKKTILSLQFSALAKDVLDLDNNENNKEDQTDSNFQSNDNQDPIYSNKDYANHALRAYLACCLCKQLEIKPPKQIKNCKSTNIESYPRLADCILMNIKDESTQNKEENERLQKYKELVKE